MNFNPECNYNPSTERWNAFVETTLLQPMPEIIGFAFYSVRGRLLSRFGLLSQLNNQTAQYLKTIMDQPDLSEPVIRLSIDAECELIYRIHQKTMVDTLGKLRDIFITRTHWDCVGGLPGLALTLADATTTTPPPPTAGSNSDTRGLRVHGPRNLTHFFNSTRHFINRKQFPLDTREFGRETTILAGGSSSISDIGQVMSCSSPFFKDNNLTVHAVELRPTNRHRHRSSTTTVSSGGDDSAEEEGELFTAVRKRKASPSAAAWPKSYQLEKAILGSVFHSASANSAAADGQIDTETAANVTPYMKLPKTRPDYTSLCYLCEGPAIPPKFDQHRATELGIPKGPVRAQLVRGQPITLADGRTIQPDEVCSPGRPATAFMVLDLPSVDYLDALIGSTEIDAFASQPQLGCVVHMVADDVVADGRYKSWLRERFHSNCQHIICSPRLSLQSVLFRSAAAQQAALKRIEPTAYVIPFGRNEAVQSLASLDLPESVVAGEPLLRFEMEPQPSRINREDCVGKVPNNQQRTTAALKYPPRENNVSDITVQFLGTGSMTPSKYRNVSGISLTFGERGHFLMDTGEGSLGQLFRMHGPTGVREYLQTLRGIFISHLHADHHLGLMRVIQEYGKVRSSTNDDGKLEIIGPKGLWYFLCEYSQVQPLQLDRLIRFTDANSLWYAGRQSPGLLRDLKQRLHLQHLATFPVIHCPQAYGLYLMTTHQSSGVNADGQMSYGITYSGDTRPCDDLVEASVQHASLNDILIPPGGPLRPDYHGLLIHEATFGNDMLQDAIDRRHSTTGEAIEMAKRMRAKELLLTHFSQRYPKVEDAHQQHANTSDSNSSGKEEESLLAIGAAVDMMQVRVGDVRRRLYGKSAQTAQIIAATEME